MCLWKTIIVVILINVNQAKDIGPFYIPDWETPTFSEGQFSGKAEAVIFPDQIKAILFSSRAWRYVWEWSFLNSHKSEVNSYVIVPDMKEAREWVERLKCKVGDEFETSRDSDCYKDLRDQDRNKWIDKRNLKTTPPDMKAWMSTCSLYYSCDFHSVIFPVYVNPNSFQPYIAGPHGEIISIVGDSKIKLIKIEDSFLTFSSIQNDFNKITVDVNCLWKGEIPSNSEMFCNFIKNEVQYTIRFGKNEEKKAFNNMIFYKPEIKIRKTRSIGDDSESATKGDLREIQTKITELAQNVLFLYHELLEELSNLKHISRNLILSSAKIDDNLIGKISRIPAKTKWLSDEVFVLASGIETIMHHGKPAYGTSCLGSYKYSNGRWALSPQEVGCSLWNTTKVLNIMSNRLLGPLIIEDGPEFRNASSEYSGWSFLDNGKVSLDWLDEGLKYWDKGSGFNLSLEGLNFAQIFIAVVYVIIFFVIIFLISFLCKLLKM